MILAALLIPILHPSLFLSPYNTNARGEWIYPGAYLKTSFTGTRATLHIDTRGYQGDPPKFRWSIDGEPLLTGQATTTLSLAEGLANKRHSLTVYLAASDANFDRWNEPTQIIRLRALELDDGASVHPPKDLGRKRAVFFGDSITEGAWNLGDSYRVVDKKWVDWVQHSDATQAWPFYLAGRMDIEYGVIGSGGMSWLRPSHSQIPPLPESWRRQHKGELRLWRKRPDYVIVNMGTNDGVKDTSAVAAQWLRDVRREFPKARIFVIIPFGQQNKTALESALLQVRDRRIHGIDLGNAYSAGLDKYGHSSPSSHDGLHPNASTNERLADAIYTGLSVFTK